MRAWDIWTFLQLPKGRCSPWETVSRTTYDMGAVHARPLLRVTRCLPVHQIGSRIKAVGAGLQQ